MENRYAKNEKDYITKYQEEGYTSNYRIINNQLTDVETKLSYTVEEIKIVAEHRFEGMSNPSDMSILYVIETLDGSKGTILANYSPASDTSVAEFLKKVPEKNVFTKDKDNL